MVWGVCVVVLKPMQDLEYPSDICRYGRVVLAAVMEGREKGGESFLALLALAARCWPTNPSPAAKPQTSSCQGSKTAASPHSNSRALKDGTGLPATARTA